MMHSGVLAAKVHNFIWSERTEYSKFLFSYLCYDCDQICYTKCIACIYLAQYEFSKNELGATFQELNTPERRVKEKGYVSHIAPADTLPMLLIVLCEGSDYSP